jgi:hypothetical protein
MFFNNKPTNSKQEVNLNTNFYTSYSETAQVTAGGWNNQLSVKVKPCIGTDANGIRQYAEDKSQTVSTSITPENAIALIEGYEAEIVPAINGEKESGATSIVMGSAEQRKVLTIGYENGNAYLSVAVALDENGKAGGEIRHTFNKKSYLINYNPATGRHEEKIVEADLINFIDKVKSVKDLAPVTAHAIKYNEMSRAAYTGNTNNTTSTTYHANTTPSQVNTGYQAPVTNSTSMDDFLPF